MADVKKIVPGNVEGEFFVDKTCINCDTCRQLAPHCFVDGGEYSRVYKQPQGKQARIEATEALLACPTGSIGSRLPKTLVKEATQNFPKIIEDNVYYCGFNSAKSYGGNSFLIVDPAGNWLIDSPRFNRHLVERFGSLGGLKYIFLTHEDDTADAGLYQAEFKAKRIIHEAAAFAEPDCEITVSGFDSFELEENYLIICTPGHSLGHMVLDYRQKFLFSGDHLHYDRDTKQLRAFPRHCWYSFAEQTKSMEKLMEYDFQWVLAGHGDRVKMNIAEIKQQLRILSKDMHKMI